MKQTKGLSANALKLIAICAMAWDHAAYTFFDMQSALEHLTRFPGRIAAPVMCYMIAEGFYHTHDRGAYLKRLVLFALLAHVPYNLFLGVPLSPFAATSVMWALAMGLCALMAVKSALPVWAKCLLTVVFCVLSYSANWNYVAVLWIVGFGCFHGDRKKQLLCFCLIGLVFYILLPLAAELSSCLVLGTYDQILYWNKFGIFLAVPLLLCYNGTRGKNSPFISRFFYAFYPLHLLALYLLAQIV